MRIRILYAVHWHCIPSNNIWSPDWTCRLIVMYNLLLKTEADSCLEFVARNYIAMLCCSRLLQAILNLFLLHIKTQPNKPKPDGNFPFSRNLEANLGLFERINLWYVENNTQNIKFTKILISWVFETGSVPASPLFRSTSSSNNKEQNSQFGNITDHS